MKENGLKEELNRIKMENGWLECSNRIINYINEEGYKGKTFGLLKQYMIDALIALENESPLVRSKNATA